MTKQASKSKSTCQQCGNPGRGNANQAEGGRESEEGRGEYGGEGGCDSNRQTVCDKRRMRFTAPPHPPALATNRVAIQSAENR